MKKKYKPKLINQGSDDDDAVVMIQWISEYFGVDPKLIAVVINQTGTKHVRGKQ